MTQRASWSWVIGLAFGMLLLAFFVLGNSPEAEVVFDFPEGKTFYEALPLYNLDAASYDVCQLEISSPIACGQASLLFLSPFNRDFQMDFRYDFDTGRANHNNKIWINLKKHNAWQGAIRAVLLVPTTRAQTATIRKMRFVQSNLISKLKAWWADFTVYHDPFLGTCFAMASPFFINNSYNAFFMPFIFVFFILAGIVALASKIFALDQRFFKVAVGIFFGFLLLVWGLHDLRYNAFYLKTMQRDSSLYWGKSLPDKRKIAVGDPEFIDFMKFCDEAIPLDARIFNGVPTNLPGSPPDYLAKVQFIYNLRPRQRDVLAPASYCIYYKPAKADIGKIVQEQHIFGQYLDLAPREQLTQEIKLWQASKHLSQVNIWVRETTGLKQSLELLLLNADKKTIAGRGEYLRHEGQEAVFRFIPAVNYNKNEKMILRLTNKGNSPIGIGFYYGELYNEGGRFLNETKLVGDLTFRLIYRPNDLRLYKRFNQDAFILTE